MKIPDGYRVSVGNEDLWYIWILCGRWACCGPKYVESRLLRESYYSDYRSCSRIASKEVKAKNIVVMNTEASNDSWYHRFTVWVRVERIAHFGGAQYAKFFSLHIRSQQLMAAKFCPDCEVWSWSNGLRLPTSFYEARSVCSFVKILGDVYNSFIAWKSMNL